jgi:hypothetical protein
VAAGRHGAECEDHQERLRQEAGGQLVLLDAPGGEERDGQLVEGGEKAKNPHEGHGRDRFGRAAQEERRQRKEGEEQAAQREGQPADRLPEPPRGLWGAGHFPDHDRTEPELEDGRKDGGQRHGEGELSEPLGAEDPRRQQDEEHAEETASHLGAGLGEDVLGGAAEQSAPVHQAFLAA